jgi:hypothetical protein
VFGDQGADPFQTTLGGMSSHRRYIR